MDALALEPARGSVRPVRLYPDQMLKSKAELVRDITDDVITALDDLVATMLSLPRCVGLAAPQIGELRRVVVVDVSRHPKAPSKNHGLLEMINPEIRLAAGEKVSREGCVSVPELTANVRRAQNVAVAYIDREGREKCIEASGFEAIALQHEIDHLEGLLFLDRVLPQDVFKRRRP